MAPLMNFAGRGIFAAPLAVLFAVTLAAQPASAGVDAAPNSSGGQPATEPSRPVETALADNFRQRVDDPHISSSLPKAVSVHGWWEAINPDYKSKTAHVQIILQRWNGNDWVEVARGSDPDAKPGGGAGNRATARYECRGSTSKKYRAGVDVDIHGTLDSAEVTISSERWFLCS